MTWEAASQTYIDIEVFIGVDPSLGLHVTFRSYWAGGHAGVYFVAGAIQEPRVDEHHAFSGPANTLLEVDGGAPLLVHDAELDGVWSQAQGVFNPGKKLDGKAHFIGTVHLGLDDIDAARAGVSQVAVAFKVVHGAEGREHGIHDAFGDFLALGT